MAERDDQDRTNDPVTAPPAEDATPRKGAAEERQTPAEDRLPRQSEMNASHMDREEAASRQQAKKSGRSAAKLFGIGLVLLVVIVLFGGFFIGDESDAPTAAGEVGAGAE